MSRQNTIARPVTIEGIGLHTGVPVHVRLLPAPSATGIVFRRVDLDGFTIKATAKNVARVSYATSLMRKGVLISTTEHLLSALAAFPVDNAIIEIDNLEVPIVDGSALPFLKLIREAGLKQQRATKSWAKIVKSIEIVDGQKRIAIHPAEQLEITYRISFQHPLIGEQERTFTMGQTAYEQGIAPARTFGFFDEVEMLRRSGLVRGGSLENAIVLTKTGVMNPEGLRFPDEFCRHKILDVIGDLAMFGRPLLGHIVADRAGHAMHIALVNRLLRDKSAWKLVRAPHAVHAKISSESPAIAASPAS
ncbi:MAG: UDP-3-O-acyl-N-acetylglucosamine deacetylase [Acidobacteria bacterium]|nr:MAG: UDP-3-O-acyl-N-acetylglucosamine deacetylase [Acidobacteriota bacterium]